MVIPNFQTQMQVILLAQARPSGAGDSQEGRAFQTGGALCNLQLTEVGISDSLNLDCTETFSCPEGFPRGVPLFGCQQLSCPDIGSVQQETCRFKA